MSLFPKIEILTSAEPYNTRVFINGKQMEHLTEISITYRISEPPLLQVTQLSGEVIVNAAEGEVRRITICPLCKAEL